VLDQTITILAGSRQGIVYRRGDACFDGKNLEEEITAALH
jgi:hypothetical protein